MLCLIARLVDDKLPSLLPCLISCTNFRIMSVEKHKNLTILEKFEILEKFYRKSAAKTIVSFASSVGIPESHV